MRCMVKGCPALAVGDLATVEDDQGHSVRVALCNDCFRRLLNRRVARIRDRRGIRVFAG